MEMQSAASKSGATARPVRKTLIVRVAPDVAFQRFTAEIGRWWPMRTHSVGEHETTDVILEGHVGGRLFERTANGTEHPWGSVIAWEPPSRVVFTWHVGRAPSAAQEVEVRFTRDGSGGTVVELEHRGWEHLPDEARTQRDRYDSGWTGVLAHYEKSLA